MGLFQKRFHPCGGYFLEGALKWLIPANVIMLFIGLAMLAQDVYALWDRWMRDFSENKQDFYIRLSMWLGYIVHVGIALPWDIILYQAKKNKAPPRLRVWVVINFVNSILATADYWIHTFYFGIHFQTLVPYNFYCIYRFYMCLVVYYFALEIEDAELDRANARLLTDQELKEFENGAEIRDDVDFGTKALIDKVQYQRYNRDLYEVRADKLEIDTENPLGSGAYGVVYRGILHQKDGASMPVAVKTFESNFMDALCFKALLTELKVMTCLGKHENIVNLVGAVTAEIKSRNLQMILEFCPFGCLLENLRASRGLYVNMVKSGEITVSPEVVQMEDEDFLTTRDLMKWAYEIACGMAFLEERKVVHGDLAARNLLLTEKKQIKIGDFGLARQLYQYSVYVKRQNVPLPWRWLALEALTDMNFSTKSDVWSYAVVLHEIFTLGEAPYQARQFSLDFVESIRNGMRLEQVAFCPNNIYAVMQQCWHESPESRPTFHNLREYCKQAFH